MLWRTSKIFHPSWVDVDCGFLRHLLSRRGMAQRIGDLLGRLEFSDAQLQQTEDGLQKAGVSMPNFGGVGRELAKEINEDPEEELETGEERKRSFG